MPCQYIIHHSTLKTVILAVLNGFGDMAIVAFVAMYSFSLLQETGYWESVIKAGWKFYAAPCCGRIELIKLMFKVVPVCFFL